jgi:Thioredoxin like C-terminal domain
VTVDETAPGNNNGADINAAGEGVINEQRLYQLIRQKKGPVTEHNFEIRFVVPVWKSSRSYSLDFGGADVQVNFVLDSRSLGARHPGRFAQRRCLAGRER